MTINNNNIFGAFTLGEVRSGRLTGDWLNKESVANYGWFGGGNRSTNTVDRINFSNDSATAQSRGVLSTVQSDLAATGNSNYGWFGGGLISNPTTIVNRIDFSSDSSTATARGPLSLARYQLAATGNSNYGWFGGGQTPSVSTVDRIDFSNDSVSASRRGPLSLQRYSLAATGNSNYGWFGGGYNPSAPVIKSTVDRIDFSNDSSTATARGPLFTARIYLAATGNSNYGWFGGGYIPSGPLATVDRIDFSNDSSTASPRGPLSLARYQLAATGNSNYGWFGGGSSLLSTVDRIDFSNDSVSASPRGSLSPSGRQFHAATSGVLNIRRQKAGNYGWFGGGVNTATVDRIDFSNDSATASPRGPLSSGRYTLSATGNSNYGWFGGGLVPSFPAFAPVSRIDRIDFSNDSSTASVRVPLSLERYQSAATGNSNYGWFIGGRYFFAPTPSGLTINRINFSNDLGNILSRSNFEKFSGSATGNSNYGWFGGGYPGPTAAVDRIDFSNDSTISSRGSLSAARGYLAATGNSNYGWFGGGYNPTIPSAISKRSTVDRINFSNDLTTASVRGPLNSTRYRHAATGNSNYGWFGGGVISTTVATVDRIDFSNDSVSASPKSPLSLARYGLAATSNISR